MTRIRSTKRTAVKALIASALSTAELLGVAGIANAEKYGPGKRIVGQGHEAWGSETAAKNFRQIRADQAAHWDFYGDGKPYEYQI